MNETKYHARNNNCQKWVLIMLEKVEILYQNQKLGMLTLIFNWVKSILSMKNDEQENNSDQDVRPDIQTLMKIVEQKGIRQLKEDGVLLPSMHYIFSNKNTLQKFGMYGEINCLKKRFKICHILYIRKVENPK